jgi:hypothetical protein
LIKKLIQQVDIEFANIENDVCSFFVIIIFYFFFCLLNLLKLFFKSCLFNAHASRDETARNEQKRGLIQFHVINNSLAQETGKHLKKFKIFEKIQQNFK